MLGTIRVWSGAVEEKRVSVPPELHGLVGKYVYTQYILHEGYALFKCFSLYIAVRTASHTITTFQVSGNHIS